MRVLIDILHPAHVHFFNYFRREMCDLGHEVLVTAREKDVAIPLLTNLAIPHEILSRQRSGFGLAIEMMRRTTALVSIARRFKPDVMTGIMGPSIAVAGRLLGIPSIVFYDTEFATQTNWFVYPLATAVCTPDCYQAKVRGNHITYPGYHELAYLHPRRFTPDRTKLEAFGVRPDETYFVVRFVSWAAIHDRKEIGLTLDQKRTLIECLKSNGRVIITSESALPADLQGLRSTGPVEDVHHLLAFARLVVGESATMSSEAAVLGTPAVFVATTGRGYTDDQEARYGLVRHYKDREFTQALNCVMDFVKCETLDAWSREARDRLLSDKIDVTAWMVKYFTSRFGA